MDKHTNVLHFKGLRLKSVAKGELSPSLHWSAPEVPAGPPGFLSLNPLLEKIILSILGTANHALLRTLSLSKYTHSKMYSETKPETTFCFQVDTTRMLCTKIFITRSLPTFNDCTIFRITFRSFFAFSDAGLLKMFLNSV